MSATFVFVPLIITSEFIFFNTLYELLFSSSLFRFMFLLSIKSKLLSFTIAPAAFVGPSLPSVPADNSVNFKLESDLLIFFIKCKANS